MPYSTSARSEVDGPSDRPNNSRLIPGANLANGLETRSSSIGRAWTRYHNEQAEPQATSFTKSHRSREHERQSARSYFHGSYYHHQPSPEHREWASLGASAIRDQTAELASLALSPSSSFNPGETSNQNHLPEFPPLDRTVSLESPLPPSLRPAEGFNPRDDVIIEEAGSSSPDSTGGSGGPSNLTRLLRTSPPEEAIVPSPKPRTPRLPRESNHDIQEPTERDGLISRDRNSHEHRQAYQAIPEREIEAQHANGTTRKYPDESRQSKAAYMRAMAMRVSSPKTWDRSAIWRRGVVAPVSTLPAVVLGLLLNVLDGLSYGMILFPLSEAIFSDLAPDGLSMFYVSCIVSQLVYSLGGSRFAGGVGSEMIEVVPFFHKMAFTIMNEVGIDRPEVVLSTTIVSMALSSIVTGLVFFLLGYVKGGSLIGYFPRHMLVGCIGGVGWFLVATGIEVATRLDGSLEYDLDTLRHLFTLPVLYMWLLPLGLALGLLVILQFINHPFTVPIFFLSVPAIFYVIIAAVPSLTLDGLRKSGWLFDVPTSGVPFWHFYTLYDFRLVDWGVVFLNIPAMLALTFFGILHVPINVPSLGVSLNMDNVDVDRELVAHGISNVVSGCVGSIQNYLVYSNSVLFIRSGGNSRLAGVMLAIGTTGVWMAGPSIIGFIPVFVVAALIFLLGIELMREALWDTWGKLHRFEYITVCVIVVTMGVYDFVIGILVGIVLACISFVIQSSRQSAIQAKYTGAMARSTVRRHPFQQRFLKEVGEQIHLYKLAGYLFFGTITQVDTAIRGDIDEHNFSQRPIRFLILDMTNVRGIDFSAAETFVRIQRTLQKRSIVLVISGIPPNGEMDIALQSVGVNSEGGIRVFPDLNDALEWCENEFLGAYYAQKDHKVLHPAHLEVPNQRSTSAAGIDVLHNSPRINQLRRAATNTMQEAEASSSKWGHFKQPLPLILQTFQERTTENEDFWFGAIEYFEKKTFLKGAVLFRRGDVANEVFLVQEGMLRAEYDHHAGSFYESITAGTTCGELPFFSETPRTATVAVERDTVTWVLTRESWNKLQEDHHDIANELLRLSLKLTTERMDAITSYIMTRAG